MRAGVDDVREHRALRVGKNHPDVRRGALHEAPDARQRAPGADAADDGIQAMLHLRPDLGSGPRFVCARVGRIGKLIDIEGAGGFIGDPLRHVLVILGMALADVRARHHDLDAHRAQVKDLLLAHLVGDDEPQPIALVNRRECETEAGVAGGRLDDRSARREFSFLLGGLDHPQRDSILDRATGILRFELRVELATTRVELRQADHRRVADQVEGIGVGCHATLPVNMVIWVAMKTTIEIPDPLFRKAKSRAAERGQTLKEFVTHMVPRSIVDPWFGFGGVGFGGHRFHHHW